jgi:thiol peroxidase
MKREGANPVVHPVRDRLAIGAGGALMCNAETWYPRIHCRGGLNQTNDKEPKTMAQTRTVIFKGNPVELAGPQLKPGDKAPDFSCVGAGLSIQTLADTAGKARLFNVVPSLDTPVCNKQTRKFSEELQALGDKAAAFTISLDLPFAQQRWCTDAKVENVKNLSDVRDHSFGEHYGVLMKGLPIALLARAVFVVDPQGTIQYAEYVPEIAQEPDYEPALAALKKAAGA